LEKLDFADLDARLKLVQGFLKDFVQSEYTFGEKWTLKNEYQSPYRGSMKGDLERFIENFRKELIEFIVGKVRENECPNVDISQDVVLRTMNEKLGSEGFDAKTVAQYIRDNFVKKAEDLSIAQLMARVENLIPRFVKKEDGSWPKARPATADDLVEGRKLKLHIWTYPGYKGTELHYEAAGHIAALGKIIQIVLVEADPVTVGDEVFASLLSLIQADRAKCFRRIDTGTPVEWVQFFKNGRFDLLFAASEWARRVAEFIVANLPKRDY